MKDIDHNQHYLSQLPYTKIEKSNGPFNKTICLNSQHPSLQILMLKKYAETFSLLVPHVYKQFELQLSFCCMDSSKWATTQVRHMSK